MRTNTMIRVMAVTITFLALAAPTVTAVDEPDPAFQALQWRNIGPFNGGRGTTVVGHPTDRNVFYFGHSSGGLWKTEDAGTYWIPVGEGQFNYASVGAIALYEKNPDIMYVGLGEPQLRQSVSWGDGMYKTVDGGETWQHIGLTDALHIARVRIHPDNPDLVYVASMGHAFGPNEEKGVFRTKDGGKSWERILFESPKSGAIDLVMDPTNPDVLFAAIWEFERKAWGAKTGGPESGIYRTKDGRLVSTDANITARPFYFYHVYADPNNADNLWVPGNKAWKSTDGGETWSLEPSIKDDFQDIWIDPNDSNRMVLTCDGGTTVTLTGGKTWSSFANQSGTQFYRVDTDDEFPYNVYSNSQDLLVYRVPSASRWGGIPLHMTEFIGNGETGSVIPHPENSDIVYSLSTGAAYGAAAHFTINNLKTGQNETRSVWPEVLFGTPASEFKYRFNWQAPFLISPHDPDTIYFAGNVVFRSRDEGMTWEKISDDLTHNMTDKMEVAGSPWLPEYFGQEIFSTIHRLVESRHEEGVLWAGSDDGLLHLTRDGGRNWTDVTPPDLPELSGIYEIEVSPHDKATTYIAITRYRKADDYSPYLLKTADYGKTWTRLDGNFPKGQVTKTIREDTVRQGLLFVGTETGIFASIDDGENWRTLNLNMPPLPVFDIKVKNADLIVATHGAGFWILDDISPLRQYSAYLAAKNAHLFEPEDHTRFGYNWWLDYGGGPPSDEKYFFVRNAEPGYTFYERGVINGERQRDYIDAGDARPRGVILYYLLSDEAGEVNLSILDAEGNEIRTFGTEELPTEKFSETAGREYSGGSDAGQARAGISKGLNRFMWDMRYPSVSAIPGVPPVLIKPIAKPGTYQVRLTVDGESQTESFELRINPNETYTREQTDALGEFWMELYAKAEDGVQTVLAAKAAQERVSAAIEAGGSSAELKAQGAVVDQLCTDFTGSMVATGTTLVQVISEPTKPLSMLVTLHNILETSEGPPNQPLREVYAKVAREMDASIADFDTALNKEMAKFEELAH